MPGREHAVATAVLAAGLALTALAAGCSRPPATAQASVGSCTQFGVAAIRHHVTVTALPPACRGLTRAQVNFAVATALRSAAGGAGGKARQHERIAAASHFLGQLVTTVPPQHSRPPVPAVAASQASPATLGLIALGTWLITLALGLSMMARWILRRLPHAGAGRPRRPPALNAAHLVLASTSLLTWIVYLATRVTGLAWAACALLLLVAGLGMTLVFLPASASPGDGPAAPAFPAGTAGDRTGGDLSRSPRPPVFAVAAHIVFATATILLAVLTAVGLR
jgi:manganese efflux pump family protein